MADSQRPSVAAPSASAEDQAAAHKLQQELLPKDHPATDLQQQQHLPAAVAAESSSRPHSPDSHSDAASFPAPQHPNIQASPSSGVQAAERENKAEHSPTHAKGESQAQAAKDEARAAQGYETALPDDEPATPVRTKIYFNKLFTAANKHEAYPVYTLQLHKVPHFFKPHPKTHRLSSDSDAGDEFPKDEDVEPKKLPTHLTNPIYRFFERIVPNAKTAAERQRLREVLSAQLITQNYNSSAPRIKATFAHTPQAAALRATCRAAHRSMYGKSFLLGKFKRREKSWISSGDQLIQIIESHGGGVEPVDAHKPKDDEDKKKLDRKRLAKNAGPEYTYTLLADGVFHFSRGDTPVLNIASKHMMHSSCSPTVVYAGTMRIEESDENGRKGLVLDNDSGTYAPRTDRGELERLEELLRWNFPGLQIEVRAFVPPGLEKQLGYEEDGETKLGEKKEGKAEEDEQDLDGKDDSALAAEEERLEKRLKQVRAKRSAGHLSHQ
ncbi:hypothetical protein HKX48_008778 [Thoreauomyces humboldtii]|nr:hypothetical protein HKX48_008778 [Thoreauomyces humboldtii]